MLYTVYTHTHTHLNTALCAAAGNLGQICLLDFKNGVIEFGIRASARLNTCDAVFVCLSFNTYIFARYHSIALYL